MKIILFVISLVMSMSAFAGCKKDFLFLQNKTKVKLVRKRVVEVKSQDDLTKFREAELKAIKNYIQYLNFSFEDGNTLEITTDQYQSIVDGTSVGYRISVIDSKDESKVKYYIKINVGMEDVAYLILYRSWESQYPERTFLCETY